MPNKSIEDFDFAVLCLKHSSKPNFDEVARELGCTKNAAYHRHYGMMRKFATGNAIAATPKTPPTPKKRGRKSKHIDDSIVEDDEDIDESPSKKIKGKAKALGKAKVEKIDEEHDDDVAQAHIEIVKVESEEDAGK